MPVTTNAQPHSFILHREAVPVIHRDDSSELAYSWSRIEVDFKRGGAGIDIYSSSLNGIVQGNIVGSMRSELVAYIWLRHDLVLVSNCSIGCRESYMVTRIAQVCRYVGTYRGNGDNLTRVIHLT